MKLCTTIKQVLYGCMCAFFILQAKSPHLIIISFMPYPNQHTNMLSSSISQGIPVTYFGNRAFTDNVGIATFWYEGDESLFYLLVSDSIRPQMAYNNTVDYWYVPENSEHEFYVIEKKYDTSLKLYFWNIQKCNMKEARIPINTVVIHVHPKKIYVPTGVVVSNNNPQMVVPSLYIKDEHIEEDILRFTNINEFFGRITQSSIVSHDDLRVNTGS